MKKILLATAIAALSISAAQAYQFELNGGASFVNFEDPTSSTDTKGVGIGGTLYFNEVSGKNGPFAEAAFIERASNVGTSLSYSKNDDFDIKSNNLFVTGEFYVPNSDFYAAASFGQTSEKVSGFAADDTNFYTARIGFLPLANLLLTAGVAGFEEKGTLGAKGNDPIITAKLLTKSGSNDVNFEGSALFGDGFNAYAISSDYYLDRTVSIGASLNYSDVDFAENAYTFGVNARKFIAENFSVQGGVSVGETSFNEDTFGAQIAATYRF